MSKAKYVGYEQLETILGEALEQAAAGKGKERHATGQAFEDQPMQLVSKLLGDNHGLAFQAIKKVQEALRLPDDRAERELLGAINYIAGMIIFLREAAKSTPNADELTPSKVKPAMNTPYHTSCASTRKSSAHSSAIVPPRMPPRTRPRARAPYRATPCR